MSLSAQKWYIGSVICLLIAIPGGVSLLVLMGMGLVAALEGTPLPNWFTSAYYANLIVELVTPAGAIITGLMAFRQGQRRGILGIGFGLVLYVLLLLIYFR